MPNNLLGRLLDHGRVSAYAVHLLAIKYGKGPGFALKETDADKPANDQSASRRRTNGIVASRLRRSAATISVLGSFALALP